MFGQALQGPGFTMQVPPGFQLAAQPLPFHYVLLPPGSDLMTVPAMLQIRPVAPFEIQMLLQNLYHLENPMVAMANAANLGIAGITAMAPPRQQAMGATMMHIREFEGMTMRGYPVRVMVIVLQGRLAAVEILIAMNLYRWVEFVGPCMTLVASVQLAGEAPPAGQVQAVIDPARMDQIEYQIISPDHGPLPMTALPTTVGGNVIINVEKLVYSDNRITTGNINGTGVVVGNHSTAKVS